MKIFSTQIYSANIYPKVGQIYHADRKNHVSSYQNLAPLRYDTVSFGAMKKKEFEGFDLAVVEKFKAPIEKFRGKEEFNNWCQGECKKIVDKDYGGRQPQTRIQRKAMLEEWSDYVLEENDAYTPAMQLVILDAVTKDLKPDTDKIPPVLNKGVLADCILGVNEDLKKDAKQGFDFNKIYNTKLSSYYLDDDSTGMSDTKWVKIPSKKNDPENFEANVEKLKTLSHKNWCTKSFNAEPYLKDGDFHVYLENGEPKIGVRFCGNTIQEIQGEMNNGEIPLSHLDVVDKHVKENNFNLSTKAADEISEAKLAKKSVDDIKNDLSETIKNNDVEKIFDYLGYQYSKTEDNKLILDRYKQPSNKFTFTDLGIDENKLIENVVEIKGEANFEGSNIKKLTNLNKIGGSGIFTNSKIKSLGNLQYVGSIASFMGSEVEDIGELREVRFAAYFSNSKIKSFNKLEKVGYMLGVCDSNVEDLGNLTEIPNDISLGNSNIKSLKNIKRVNGSLWLCRSKVNDLGDLEYVGKDVWINHGQFKEEDFKNVKIGGQIIYSFQD